MKHRTRLIALLLFIPLALGSLVAAVAVSVPQTPAEMPAAAAENAVPTVEVQEPAKDPELVILPASEEIAEEGEEVTSEPVTVSPAVTPAVPTAGVPAAETEEVVPAEVPEAEPEAEFVPQPLSPKALSAEQEKAIILAYRAYDASLSERSEEDCLQYVKVLRYFGTYSGASVQTVQAQFPETSHPCVIVSETIDGVRLSYPGNGCYAYVFYQGRILRVAEAFSAGILTHDDLLSIRYYTENR